MSAKSLKRQTIDFNKFRTEYRSNKSLIVIEIGNESVAFPAELPASVMLDMMAWMRENGEDAEMPTDLAANIFSDLLGTEAFDDLVRRHNLDIHEMMWLFGQIMTIYMSEDSLQGNPLTPLNQPSTSSSNGRSSKQTSKATTESN